MTARPSLGPGSGTAPGPTFFAEYQAGMKGLFDAAAFPLTNVGGTADDVTADLEWDLDGGALVDGMKFTLTWDATNTGPMTLAINGGSPVDVLDASGGTMVAGAMQAGVRSQIEYIGGDFRVLGVDAATVGAGAVLQVFTASGTWTKPPGLEDDRLIIVENFGAGGGGGSATNAGGGGGGGYNRRYLRAGDLASSVSVTVGAGGAVGSAGGNSLFGAHATAYGGGPGGNPGAVVVGGGGGGLLGAGGNGTAGAPSYGGMGGGAGGSGGVPGIVPGAWGGGGGAGQQNNGNGGSAIWGGGGGAGMTGGTGGASVYGGAGGSSGNAGQAPGGGGSRNNAGARGEVRVWII